ncbi:hypothetical protein ADU00_11645 [Salmonella enterica subsp. enterica]|nr:hypothetical protein [Salmonella enterica subsp. enterica serovar Hvittingfoss]
MKYLTREECKNILGNGINIAPALHVFGELGAEAAHASEGVAALGEALGWFDHENGNNHSHKYTTDPHELRTDVYIANSYLHEMQTHSGSDKITDGMRNTAINHLQNDGRVYYNPVEGKFEALGGVPQYGVTTPEMYQHDSGLTRMMNYVMHQDEKNVHSHDYRTSHNALESIKNSTREGAYHYDVKHGKFELG